jgi:hypothetical protein
MFLLADVRTLTWHSDFLDMIYSTCWPTPLPSSVPWCVNLFTFSREADKHLRIWCSGELGHVLQIVANANYMTARSIGSIGGLLFVFLEKLGELAALVKCCQVVGTCICTMSICVTQSLHNRISLPPMCCCSVTQTEKSATSQEQVGVTN